MNWIFYVTNVVYLMTGTTMAGNHILFGLIFCFAFLGPTYGLYEDQIGKFDW